MRARDPALRGEQRGDAQGEDVCDVLLLPMPCYAVLEQSGLLRLGFQLGDGMVWDALRDYAPLAADSIAING